MNGYPRKKPRASHAVLLLLMMTTLPVTAGEDSAPDMALLEFLGEWETPDGEWIDPVELETATAGDEAEVIDE